MNSQSIVQSLTLPSLDTINKARLALDQLEADVDALVKVPPALRNQVHAIQRVPAEAIRLALELAQANPGRFPDFDAARAAEVLAFDAAIMTLVRGCRAVADRFEEASRVAWYEVGLETLALYGAARSLDRLPTGMRMRENLKELQSLLATRTRRVVEEGDEPPEGPVAVPIGGSIPSGTVVSK